MEWEGFNYETEPKIRVNRVGVVYNCQNLGSMQLGKRGREIAKAAGGWFYRGKMSRYVSSKMSRDV